MADFPQMLPEHLLKVKAIRARMPELTLSQKVFIESILENKPLDEDQVFILNQVYYNLKDTSDLLLPRDHGVLELEAIESCGRVG